MGSFSVYSSNSALYSILYGTQTWMQATTSAIYEAQKKAKEGSAQTDDSYKTNDAQKIARIAALINRGNNGYDIYDVMTGTPGVTIYANAFGGFMTDMLSLNNAYQWIQDDLFGNHTPSASAIADFITGAADIGIGARLSSVSNVYQKLRSTTPLWARYSTLINPGEFNALSKAGSIVGKIATPLSAVTTAYSVAKVYNEWDNGGVSNIKGWDVADASVGIVGLTTTGLVWGGFMLASNPVGWAIGAGCVIYGGVRIGMDIYDYYKKP
jgi:hypothetical protein